MWIFTSIFRVANTLAHARDAVLAVADRRTEAVATYFERIAQTTEELQRELAKHRAPYEQVARLRTCAADFTSIVDGVLPDEQVRYMAEDLLEFDEAKNFSAFTTTRIMDAQLLQRFRRPSAYFAD